MMTSVLRRQKIKQAKTNWVLYLMILPAFAYIFLFHYLPLYGVQIAFRDYTLADGISGSPWVGLQWFRIFFASPRNRSIILNTLSISLYYLVASFPISIIFALLLNQVKQLRFKKLVQSVTYMPHFISTVVIVGMISAFFSPNSGFINTVAEALTGQRFFFMGTPKYYMHIYVWSGIWQNFGWSSIIYMAALASVDMELHEAAMIDGANKFQRIWHIDIPAIMPVMIIILILSSANIMTVGFEKSYLMQNDLNIEVSEVISTYTYKVGIGGVNYNANNMGVNRMYSYAAAIGLFNNIICFVILIIVNQAAKRLSKTSLW
jgi:putative aldouronate transport system permease protein